MLFVYYCPYTVVGMGSLLQIHNNQGEHLLPRRQNRFPGKVAMVAIAIVSFANLFQSNHRKILDSFGIGIIIRYNHPSLLQNHWNSHLKAAALIFVAIPENLKEIKNWFWILTPIIRGAITLPWWIVCFTPQLQRVHILSRAASLITYDTTVTTIIMLFILAGGREYNAVIFKIN